jgi:hypothetical protein
MGQDQADIIVPDPDICQSAVGIRGITAFGITTFGIMASA